MARKKAVRSRARRPRVAGKAKAAPAKRSTGSRHRAIAPMRGATRRDVGGVRLELARAGGARVKRIIYPRGFRWSVDMKPLVGTDLCMHAHVGFLADGEIHVEYADGCVAEFKAPQAVAIEPGHDGWVVGDAPAVLIELDFEGDTVDRLGMPSAHRHS